MLKFPEFVTVFNGLFNVDNIEKVIENIKIKFKDDEFIGKPTFSEPHPKFVKLKNDDEIQQYLK